MHEVKIIRKGITGDCILSKDRDVIVVIVSQGKSEFVCESRVFGSQVFVPMLDPVSDEERKKVIQEAIDSVGSIYDDDKSVFVFEFRWPDGKWGVAAGLEGDLWQ